MTAILYPVAPDAAAALGGPLGRAAREREASRLAGGERVSFVTQGVGPEYAAREAALDAHAGRVEDDRPGRTLTLPPEDRFCRLVELAAPVRGRRRLPAPLAPSFQDGRRWPEAPAAPVATVWRLQVSYWRVGDGPDLSDAPQARQQRKAGEADRDTLKALTRQPLRAVRPQQPLDIGLFEVRRPEAPHSVMPDE
ncbi:MAG: hypothetical protein H2041_08025 [Phenylobacterium sp.]|uniref:hypothetical protein n=1 Tax=Phenylobacterium sp. TaxID=1871053 RepID=UPI00184B5E82|nr:hypothetical protein [Phenylobacterium sp.]MBA4793597.1 hypothetical protein [Phenylobacterium sp.]